ncbi:hypothetical protein PGT21_015543 [Puccinia graminis f. sp. tritici]|uniref:Uncharacterized protein n=1 Tax=Puccinia graminis f. sp. tritici TaxID=56615 RepID=A0A5B0LN12_PUCGR|nr:hypothetical protein PGT21_015543 [Puccinia graminis f. sp. tritici]KAA1130541.1 hypothetical protein PGTUg99_019502 [Puccinia graminis f. sp. tritici]
MNLVIFLSSTNLEGIRNPVQLKTTAQRLDNYRSPILPGLHSGPLRYTTLFDH